METLSGVIKKETKEISELVKPELVGQTVKVNGAVHVIRDMGESAFVILRKREGLLQCVYEDGKVNVPLSEIREGTTMEVTGMVKEEAKAPHGIEIRMTDELPQFIRDNQIQIAALTLPKSGAEELAPILVENGVKAIWNFAHTDLQQLPKDVIVESVHLSESLMQLSYNLNHMEREKEREL